MDEVKVEMENCLVLEATKFRARCLLLWPVFKETSDWLEERAFFKQILQQG